MPYNYDELKESNANPTSLREYVEESKKNIGVIVKNVVEKIIDSDRPNAFYTGAKWAFTAGSTASLLSRISPTPWAPYLSTFASRMTYVGYGFAASGYLYNHFGTGSWSAGDIRELTWRPDERKLHTQIRGDSYDALYRAARRSLSDGGTYYEAFMRAKMALGYPSSFNYGYFERILISNNLVSSYKKTHPHSQIEEGYRTSKDIGGVASDVGIIETMKDSVEDVFCDEAVFCIQTSDGRSPCSDLELREIIRTIANGIFIHDTVPFFSLEFNEDTSLYPVLSPAYQDTIVGRVISLLDYYMKCYLNGGFFLEAFLSTWYQSKNTDKTYLKTHMQDFKKYCNEHKLSYMSLREAMFYENIDVSELKSSSSRYELKWHTSFRIISQQKELYKHQNVFMIHPDFRVEYTIDPTAEYQAVMDRHMEEYSRYPDEYLKAEKIYQMMANTIQTELPKLPLVRDYFQMLGIMGFFSYYFNTLKEMGKIPQLPPSPSVKAFQVPTAFPPIPIRQYKKQLIDIHFKLIFDKLKTIHPATFPKWLSTFLENTAHPFPTYLENSLKKIVHEYLVASFPEHQFLEIREELLQKAETTLYDLFLNRMVRATLTTCYTKMTEQLAKIKNRLASLDSDYIPVCPEIHQLPLKKAVEAIKAYIQLESVQNRVKYHFKFNDQESKTLAEARAKSDRLFEDEEKSVINLFEQNLAKTIPPGQEHLYRTAEGKSIAEHRIEKYQAIRGKIASSKLEEYFNIQSRLVNFILNQAIEHIENILSNPLDMFEFPEEKQATLQVPYSILEYLPSGEAGDNLKIVGGCGVDLSSLTSFSISHVKAEALMTSLEPVMLFSPAETMRQIEIEGKPYHVFILPIINQPSYSKLDHAELTQSLTKTSHTKMGDKEVKAMTQLITHLAEEKKETKFEGRDFNPNARDISGQTLVHYAASYCNSAIGNEWLLQKTSQGKQALFLAADEQGNLPLHVAAQSGNIAAIPFLCKAQPRTLEAKNKNGLTPLMLAAQAGKANVVTQLLVLGANPNLRLHNGLFALYLAVQARSQEAALALLKVSQASLNYPFWNGSSLLHMAIEMKQEALAIAFVEAGAHLLTRLKADGFTPLHLAAEMGLLAVCQAILSRMSDPNIPLPNGQTILHIVAEKGEVELLETFLELKSIQPNAKTSDGETPLMCALRHGQTEAALVLAEHAKINMVNPRKETASLIAAQHAQLRVADVLIERGENPWALDADGQYYASFLLRMGEQLRYQAVVSNRKAFAKKMTSRQLDDKNALNVAIRHQHGLLFASLIQENKQDSFNEKIIIALKTDDLGLLKKLSEDKRFSPFQIFDSQTKPTEKNLAYIAAEAGSEVCLNWLLSHYYKTLSKEKREEHIGFSNKRFHLLYAPIASGKENIIILVLEYCKNIHIRLNDEGITAGRLAVQHGHFHLLEFLHQHGADFSFEHNLYNSTAFHAAIEADDSEMLEALFKFTPKEKWPEDLYQYALNNSQACLKLIYEKQIHIPDRTRKVGSKALLAACRVNHIQEIKKLLSAGIKPGFYQGIGRRISPLSITAAFGYLESIKLVIQHSNDRNQIFSLKKAIARKQVEIILLYWDLGMIAKYSNEILQSLTEQAQDNRYVLAALKGERKAYQKDKHTLIQALEQSDRVTFARIIEQGLPIRQTLFQYKNISQPLLPCVIDEKAAWAMPIIRDQINLFEENGSNLKVLHDMLLSYGNETKLDGMTSPFQFLAKYFSDAQELENETSLLYQFKFKNNFSLSDLAILKKHPDTFQFYHQYAPAVLLHSAAQFNGLDELKKLLPQESKDEDNRININTLNSKRQSALMLAAGAGHVKIVRLLIEKEADPDLLDIYQNTALHYAIENGQVEIALRLAAITKKRDQADRYGQTPLLCAVKRGLYPLFKVLRDLDCNIQAIDHNGYNALHLAAKHNHAQIINELVDVISVDSIQQPKDEKEAKYCIGNTPLHFAAQNGSFSALITLIHHGANLLAENKAGQTPLDLAIISHRPEMWDFISRLDLIHQTEHQVHLFCAAARGEHLNAMIDLLSIGCNIDAIDAQGHTALYYACYHKKIKALALLIEHGADTHVRDSDGNTPLHIAAKQGFLSGLRQLSETKINIQAINQKKQTALHMACEAKHFPAVLQLLQLDADANVLDERGYSPFHIALVQSDWQTVHFLAKGLARLSPLPPEAEKAYNQFLKMKSSLDCSESNSALKLFNLSIFKIRKPHISSSDAERKPVSLSF